MLNSKINLCFCKANTNRNIFNYKPKNSFLYSIGNFDQSPQKPPDTQHPIYPHFQNQKLINALLPSSYNHKIIRKYHAFDKNLNRTKFQSKTNRSYAKIPKDSIDNKHFIPNSKSPKSDELMKEKNNHTHNSNPSLIYNNTKSTTNEKKPNGNESIDIPSVSDTESITNHFAPRDKVHKGLIYNAITLSQGDQNQLISFCEHILSKDLQDAETMFAMYKHLQKNNLSRFFSIRFIQKFLNFIKYSGSQSFAKSHGVQKTKAIEPRTAVDMILHVLEDRQSYGFLVKEGEYEELLQALSQDTSKSSEHEVMDLVEAILERARNFEPGSFFMTDRGFHKIIKGFASRGHVRGALWCYNKMISESDLLLKMSFKHKISETEKMALYKASNNIKPSFFTVSLITQLLQNKQMRGSLFKIWANLVLSGSNVPVSVHRGMIRMLVRRNKIEDALWVIKIARSLPTSNKNSDTDQQPQTGREGWNSNADIAQIIQAIGNEDSDVVLGESSNISDLRINARAAAENILLVSPIDLGMYSMVIQAAVSQGQSELVEQLFNELVESGVVPNKETFGFLATMYADKGRIDKVKAILHSVYFADNKHQQSKNIRENEDLLDIQFFVPLLYCYICSNKVNEAAELLVTWNEISNKTMTNEKLTSALIKIYRAVGRPELAAKLGENDLNLPIFNEIRNNLIPKTPENFGTDKIKINEKTISKVLDSAIKSSKLYKSKTEIYYYQQKIASHLETYNLEGSVQVLEEILSKNILPSRTIIFQLLYGFLDCDALDMFELLAEYYHNTFGEPLSMPLYTRWIQELSRRGDAKGAYAVLQQIIDRGLIPSEINYCMVIQACSLRGWTKQADELFREMEDPQSPVKPGISTWVSLIEAHVSSGDVLGAHSILNDIIYRSLIPRSMVPTRAFNNLIMGYLYLRQGQKAINVYETMLKSNVKPNRFTFAALMHAYSRERKIKNCVKILDQMLKSGIEPDSAIYSILIAVYGLMVDIRGAEGVFRRAELQNEKYLQARMNSPSIQLARVMIPSGNSQDTYLRSIGPGGGSTETLRSDIDTRIHPKDQSVISSSVIDPVVLVMMIKAYSRAKNLEKVVLFWKRLLQSYPILKINPRHQSGRNVAVTADFHVSSMTTLLKVFLRVLDRDEFFSKIKSMSDVSEWSDHTITTPNTNLISDEKLPDQQNLLEKNSENVESNDIQDKNLDDIISNAKDISTSTESQDVDGGTEKTEEKVVDPDVEGVIRVENTSEILKEISMQLIEVFNEAKMNRFLFEISHINYYISCLILSSQYKEIIDTLAQCKPTQTEPLDSEYNTLRQIQNSGGEHKEYQNLIRLRISEQNTIYLLGRLRLTESTRMKIESEIKKRTDELTSRYRLLSLQPRWVKNKGFGEDIYGGQSPEGTLSNDEKSGKGKAPTLDAYLINDIMIFELKRKLDALTYDRDQLLRIVKLWSNFVDSKVVKDIANTLDNN
ncbi:hypothetical protein BB559_004186 [Furculomyces boomerangus]|uniref:Pentacotripeptide-repeat region of PRORP domain-containing protein n=1 Tax=Furculomyces boomerangus TaxID=61424 RepID=A0A2T9YG78_9FUNG|nr:hypothetical protein BB559_004186 [Furculomyces boomerangus]